MKAPWAKAIEKAVDALLDGTGGGVDTEKAVLVLGEMMIYLTMAVCTAVTMGPLDPAKPPKFPDFDPEQFLRELKNGD